MFDQIGLSSDTRFILGVTFSLCASGLTLFLVRKGFKVSEAAQNFWGLSSFLWVLGTC